MFLSQHNVVDRQREQDPGDRPGVPHRDRVRVGGAGLVREVQAGRPGRGARVRARERGRQRRGGLHHRLHRARAVQLVGPLQRAVRGHHLHQQRRVPPLRARHLQPRPHVAGARAGDLQQAEHHTD